MAMYWILFATPVISGLSSVKTNVTTRRIFGLILGLLLVLVIGSRDWIGCDWPRYEDKYWATEYDGFITSISRGDMAYQAVNWIVFHSGMSIHLVNTVCAAIFVTGLLSFCFRQPITWLALTAAMPYMVTIVSMGYTRQATAIGLLMLAFNAFQDRQLLRYLVYVALASTFHKTAIVFGLLAMLLQSRFRIGPLAIGLGATFFVASFTLLDQIDFLMYGYVESSMDSDGGVFRIAVNLIAVALLLIFRRQWRQKYSDYGLYLALCSVIVLSAPSIIYAPAAADRMHLYFLPFQIAVFARIPTFLDSAMLKLPAYVGIVGAYGASLYVWLHYAGHAHCWVPYSSALFL